MSEQAPQLVEDFFRHEYGRLVAMLVARVGTENLQAVEDAAQSALLIALERWKVTGLPDSPTAWLFSVAHNRLMSGFRQDVGRQRLLDQTATEATSRAPETFLPGEIADDLLRMLFACCDPALPVVSQLVLALKTLCGFSVREIALRLFTGEASIYKRLGRARERLREAPWSLDDLGGDAMAARLPSVHAILYLLFTEGHLSLQADAAVRRELCREALRLGELLAAHRVGDDPQTCALLALMHLHLARLDARQDADGGLLLLAEQDRGRWDAQSIAVGLRWLEKSASGAVFSRYHAEAAIAAEHCLAPTLEETRWDRVAAAYALLERASPSPIHRLNRAVAVAEHAGPEAGLAVLEGFVPPTWLVGSYQWAAVLAYLHRRAGHAATARQHHRTALELAPTSAIRALLERREVESRRR